MEYYGKLENNKIIKAKDFIETKNSVISNPSKFDYYKNGFSLIKDEFKNINGYIFERYDIQPDIAERVINNPNKDEIVYEKKLIYDAFDYTDQLTNKVIHIDAVYKNVPINDKITQTVEGTIINVIYKKNEVKNDGDYIKIYDKRKLYNKSKELNVWTNIEKYLKNNDLYNDFLFAVEIKSDDPMFIQCANEVKILLNFDEKQFNEYLKECIKD